MIDALIICKEGTINSYLSALVIAMNKKKNGEDVSVVFMQEGLAALLDKEFKFAPGLEVHAKEIEKNAASMGVPSDPLELIKHAKVLGVALYACQAWMKLLGGKTPKFAIPEGLKKLELSELVEAMGEAKKVFTL